MTRPRATLLFVLFLASAPSLLRAQSQELGIESLRPESKVIYEDDMALGTNGLIVTYQDSVITAEWMRVNLETFDAEAKGNVRIQQGDQVFASEHVFYNLKTRQMS